MVLFIYQIPCVNVLISREPHVVGTCEWISGVRTPRLFDLNMLAKCYSNTCLKFWCTLQMIGVPLFSFLGFCPDTIFWLQAVSAAAGNNGGRRLLRQSINPHRGRLACARAGSVLNNRYRRALLANAPPDTVQVPKMHKLVLWALFNRYKHRIRV